MKTHILLEHLAEFREDPLNPSEPPHLVRLKPQTKPCEDCGEQCVDRVVNYSHKQLPVPHWRKKCCYCKKWYNPHTEQFDAASTDLQQIYNSATVQKKLTEK